MTFITVIIPVSYNHLKYVSATLSSLEGGTRRPDEVLLVASPPTVSYLVNMIKTLKVSFNVRIIEVKEPGIGIARKMGIDSARGDIIAFIDADEAAHPLWLQNIEHVLSGSFPIVGGRIESIEDLNTINYSINNAINNAEECREVEFIPTANMAFRREVVESIGNFDPNFIICHEDTDFVWRALRKYKIYYCPNIVTYHIKRNDVWSARKSFVIGLQTSLLFFKHPIKTIKKLMIIPLGYLGLIILGIALYFINSYLLFMVFTPLIYDIAKCFRSKERDMRRLCLKNVPVRITDKLIYGSSFLIGCILYIGMRVKIISFLKKSKY